MPVPGLEPDSFEVISGICAFALFLHPLMNSLQWLLLFSNSLRTTQNEGVGGLQDDAFGASKYCENHHERFNLWTIQGSAETAFLNWD